MPPALAPVAPSIFKKMLELEGFQLDHETGTNWTLINKKANRPVIVVPKEGEVVPLDMMMIVLDQLKINPGKFFKLKDKVVS